MRIEIVQETREEKIQRWVKKIKKRTACQKADYERLYDSDNGSYQKLAKLIADALYMSVPEDIREEVYELTRAEAGD